VAQPPAATPMIATAMINTNRGSETDSAGSVALNGSNDTATKCRLATANTRKIKLSGTTIRADRNFRMTIARVDRDRPPNPPSSRPRVGASDSELSGTRLGVIAVQTLAHLLARFEKRDALLIDRHMCAGPRIAAGACRAVFHGECTETAQLDAVAARKCCDDL